MKKEVMKHKRHLEVTFERLLKLLFSQEELDMIFVDAEHCQELLSSRSRWIRTDSLAVEGVNTERMALIHLLWLQHIGRVVVEDIDPLLGALLVRMDLTGLKGRKKTS